MQEHTSLFGGAWAPAPASAESIEVWGGPEYTCNRVGDRYFDQMELSGHATRTQDLALFAKLGIHALRCGLLWERHALDPSWKWADAYFHEMRSLGMRPIVGLVHHGSGPRDTNLLDPSFASNLAAYAGEVAGRYPWIDAYTPVNEPHTTARFACRYGVWYPHHQSEKSFLIALLNQVKATVLSMEAVRRVRPDAQLVQTEDLGRAWSTPELASTSDLWNERRWLPFDLLAGSVDRRHPLYQYLLACGIREESVLWFRDHPCPANVIGVNYYVTSDRFLDHRLELYPDSARSSEGPFVDVEAVRVRPEGIQGFEPILLQAHRRYGRPVAVTEVHLGDCVEEQVRWAAAAWHAAQRARAAGVVCHGFTFWALLGSYFWNNLVTTDNGHYEPGVFDLRSGAPQPTALADLVRQCARGRLLDHEAIDQPGWWQRPSRIHYCAQAELVA